MFKNSGVKNGIMLGVVSIVCSHVCYLINPKYLLTSVAYLSIFINAYFMYRSAIEERVKNEGLLSFVDARKYTFLTYVIGTLIGSIYIYLMFNVVDSSLQGIFVEYQNFQMNFSMVFMIYLVSLIFPGFVLALIVSALTKKEPAS